MNRRLIILLIFLFWQLALTAQKFSANTGFIENKGQIIDQHNQPNPEVKYLFTSPGFNVQLRQNGFSYDVYQDEIKNTDSIRYFIEKENLYSTIRSFHRIDFGFEDINPSHEIFTTGPSQDYCNYYTPGTPVDGIREVRSFKKVLYRNIYSGVDLEFLTDDSNQFKYNFLISRGASVHSIKLKVNGSEVSLTEKGTLLINSKFGPIEESIPYCYYVSGDRRIEINARFIRLSENIFGIKTDSIPDFDNIVIDPVPSRIWGTYYGGVETESISGAGRCIATIAGGKTVVTSSTQSLMNIASAGAFQTVYNGSTDAFVVNLNFDGTRNWCTYYGGPSGEWGFSISADKHGNIFFGGRTWSQSNIASPGAYDNTLEGDDDAFLVKLNAAGFRQWGTYYGGTGNLVDEFFTTIVIDTNDNIYCAGYTSSPNAISSPGAWQTTFGGGQGDGFLVKFTENGNRVWGTYYGGSGLEDTHVMKCDLDKWGNIYLTGSTRSPNNIASPGSFMPSLSGLQKGFLAKFDSSGQRIWGTYFGGDGITDQTFACATDTMENIYIAGFTQSLNNIATPGAFQTGQGPGYLEKFNSIGQRLWGTYIGSQYSTVQLYDCSVNDSGFIYILGNILANDPSLITSGSYQENFGGMSDIFLEKFDSAGNRKWGTYYGGSDCEFPGALICQENKLFVVGDTKSSNVMSSTNAFQTIYGGGTDNFIARFDDCRSPDSVVVIHGPSHVCENQTNIIFDIDSVPNATSYRWIVGGNFTAVSVTNTRTITVNCGNGTMAGILSVQGINECSAGALKTITIPVFRRPLITIAGVDSVCINNQVTFTTQPNFSGYQWNYSSGNLISGGSITDDSLNLMMNAAGNQWVEVNYTDTNGCNALTPAHFPIVVTSGDSLKITISPSANNICSGTSVTFTATPTGTGTLTYDWKVNGASQGVNNPIFNYTPTNGDVVTCVLSSSITTCVTNNPATSNAITMVVNPPVPVAVNIAASQNPVCLGSSVTFTASQTVPGNLSYQWFVNGNPVGTNSSTYTYTPSNNDAVHCSLLTDHPCSSNNPASSNIITMNVTANIVVAVSINASSNPICGLLPVTFTATQTIPGNLTFSWFVNGNTVGTNSSNYTYTPNNNDAVHCSLFTDHQCTTNNPANSNNITMSIIPAPVVSYTICTDSITTTNARSIKLKGGIPLGGTYSGPGVNSVTGVFSPAIAGAGAKAITYSYTNAGMCSANKTKNIIVQAPAVFICGNTFRDIRDNNNYSTVQIGSQCWFSEDLRYGTVIPHTMHQRDNCVVEKYQSAVGSQQSAVYQWDEIMEYSSIAGEKGLCPAGWHVPTEAEWQTLFGNYTNAAFAAAALKYSGFSGFNGLLTGIVPQNINWKYQNFGIFYWTSTSYGPYKAWAHGFNEPDPSASTYPSARDNAFAVRCIRD